MLVSVGKLSRSRVGSRGAATASLYSRCKYALGSDKRCWRLLASSPKVWQHMAGHFVGLLLSANGIKRVEERSSECQ